MSGVKKLVQSENKGLEMVTNEDLKEEGTCGSEATDEAE